MWLLGALVQQRATDTKAPKAQIRSSVNGAAAKSLCFTFHSKACSLVYGKWKACSLVYGKWKIKYQLRELPLFNINTLYSTRNGELLTTF